MTVLEADLRVIARWRPKRNIRIAEAVDQVSEACRRDAVLTLASPLVGRGASMDVGNGGA